KGEVARPGRQRSLRLLSLADEATHWLSTACRNRPHGGEQAELISKELAQKGEDEATTSIPDGSSRAAHQRWCRSGRFGQRRLRNRRFFRLDEVGIPRQRWRAHFGRPEFWHVHCCGCRC